MNKVLSIQDYKSHIRHSETGDGIAVVVMVWESKTRTYNVIIRAKNGDFEGVVNAIKDEGGTLQMTGESRFVFLPWPPSYIDILSESEFDPSVYEDR